MTHALDDVTPLTWRPTERSDLPALMELVDAAEYIDQAASSVAADQMESYLEHARDRKDCALLVGCDGDAPVAFAWMIGLEPARSDTAWQVRLMGEVAPTHRDKQIGPRMVEWLVGEARRTFVALFPDSDGAMDLFAVTDARNQRRQDLFDACGFEPTSWYFDLHRSFEADEQLPAPSTPHGVHIAPLSAASAPAVRLTHNAAFETYPWARQINEIDWCVSLSRTGARPEWSWVAVDDDGHVIGYALSSVIAWDRERHEGWTDRLGVIPEWRGRGIARALLTQSLRSFQRAGLTGGGLGVDSVHGDADLGLYRSLGYQSTDTIVQYGVVESVADALTHL